MSGWMAPRLPGRRRPDRFTLAAEFATRNVAVATAIAVTLLGKPEFAIFAATYFLTEQPILLASAVIYRRATATAVEATAVSAPPPYPQ